MGEMIILSRVFSTITLFALAFSSAVIPAAEPTTQVINSVPPPAQLPGWTNLDFELAIPPTNSPPMPAFGTLASLLPYWNATLRGTELGSNYTVLYDDISLDDVVTGVLHRNALDGNYSAFLQHNHHESADLWRTGIIPEWARSLHFRTDVGTLDEFSVTVDRQPLVCSPVEQFTNGWEWAADISRFAGKNVELRFGTYSQFSTNPVSPGGSSLYGTVVLDDVQFSSNSVLPLIRTGPSNQVSYVGADVSMTLQTHATVPLHYQWYKDGALIEGATNTTLSLTNVPWSGRGRYYVSVSNALGVVFTPKAELGLSQITAWSGWSTDLHQGPTPPTFPTTNFISVIASDGPGEFGFALTTDGDVVGWPNPAPYWLQDIIAMAPGNIALTKDGGLVAWPDNANKPVVHQRVQAITTGMALLQDGTVQAWGRALLQGLSNVVAVSGSSHSLYLKNDGSVLGYGTGYAQPEWLSNVVSIAAANTFDLALRDDGSVVVLRPSGPEFPAELHNVVQIQASGNVGLATRADGSSVWLGGAVPTPNLRNVLSFYSSSQRFLAITAETLPRPQVRLASPAVGSVVILEVPTRTGHTYRFEYCEDLARKEWMHMPLVAGNGAVKRFVGARATNSRFYRVREW